MIEKSMKVLSLFDGMGCLGIALKDMGVEFEYYTSEIDKHAIAQSKLNFPNSIQLGDVTKWREWNIDWSKIDLIGAGSPCQGFSFAGKQLAFDDPRSALFFVFIEILEHCKKHNPKVIYLLENVKMKIEHELVISRYLNVNPISINSALVSAQNRVRLYWTNIYNEPYGLFGDMMCMISQPKDRGILLKDVLEKEVPEKYYLSDKALEYLDRAKNERIENVKYNNGNQKTSCITANYMRGVQNSGETYVKLDKQLKPKPDQLKASCFTAGGNSGGNHSDMDLIQTPRGNNKGANFTEKSPTLTSNSWEHNNHVSLSKFKIRRLTPTECARLQTIPDWYKWECSDTQQYKMLGNGWTIEVIKHILSFNYITMEYHKS